MTKPICTARHTNFQPTDKQWVCPSCGVDSNDFMIEESAEGSSPDCLKLHASDTVFCFQCGKTWTGSRLATLMSKKVGVTTVKCSCCKGTGYVTVKNAKAPVKKTAAGGRTK